MSGSGPVSNHGVYDRLVQSHEDTVGLVAYAIYKRHKRDYVARVLTERSEPPTADQIGAFVDAAGLPDQIARYRDAALAVIGAYANAAIEKQRPGIVAEAVTERMETAARQAEAANSPWKQILVGCASAFAYTVILIAVVIVLRYAGIDLMSILDSAGRLDPAVTAGRS